MNRPARTRPASAALLVVPVLTLAACTPGEPPETPPHPQDTSSTDTGSSATDDTATGLDTGPAETDTGEQTHGVDPPLDGTSGGSGGQDHPSSSQVEVSGVDLWLLAPSGSAASASVPLLVVISGTEGGQTMMSNMRQVAPYYGLDDALVAVLDGRWATATDGAAALDGLRSLYDVDNDRTWLLSESAGTGAGLQLAFEERPSHFAAYWANDVNTAATPSIHADDLGFAPWGNAGPGGDWVDADTIVEGMRTAGWRLPADAPYSGAGADTHGSTQQFLAAVDFFADKERQ